MNLNQLYFTTVACALLTVARREYQHWQWKRRVLEDSKK